jgi:hypothetical protein
MMATVRIEVVLPADRSKLGTIQAIDTLTGLPVWGPNFCYGRADRGVAKQHGNDGAVSTKKFGDTPTGSYQITGLRPVTEAEKPKYGAQDALKIDGVSGNAMIRKANGTNDLRIHGGRPTLGTALLRPTNGCLRLLDIEMQDLLAAVVADGNSFPLDMTIDEGQPPQLVAGGDDDGYEDPITA